MISLGWCYGLVEDEKKELVLCEVYFNSKHKLFTYLPLDWKELKSNRTKLMVYEDLEKQFHTKCYFKHKDFKELIHNENKRSGKANRKEEPTFVF